MYYACVPNKYSIVLITLKTSRFIYCIVNSDKKQSLIFQIMFIFLGNSNNECCFCTLWCGVTDRCINTSVQMAAQSANERDHSFLFTTTFNAK